MSLTQDLRSLTTQVMAQMPESAQERMAQARRDLANSGIINQSLKVGDKGVHLNLEMSRYTHTAQGGVDNSPLR